MGREREFESESRAQDETPPARLLQAKVTVIVTRSSHAKTAAAAVAIAFSAPRALSERLQLLVRDQRRRRLPRLQRSCLLQTRSIDQLSYL